MKTSELTDWLEKNDWVFDENDTFINIIGLLKVNKKNKEIKFYDKNWNEGGGMELLNKVIEYTNTPPFKRENKENKYAFYSIHLDKYYIRKLEHGYRDCFTQQEIDNFPEEIKGAIECGFLKKVEVPNQWKL